MAADREPALARRSRTRYRQRDESAISLELATAYSGWRDGLAEPARRLVGVVRSYRHQIDVDLVVMDCTYRTTCTSSSGAESKTILSRNAPSARFRASPGAELLKIDGVLLVAGRTVASSEPPEPGAPREPEAPADRNQGPVCSRRRTALARPPRASDGRRQGRPPRHGARPHVAVRRDFLLHTCTDQSPSWDCCVSC